ncbi:hypothetical protein ACFL4F_01285 [Candidatus Margulisiibacteriota bacterium]
MKRSRLMVLLVFLLSLAAASFASTTSLFFDGGIISVDHPLVIVNNVYGLKLYPVNVTIRSDNKEAFIPHKIENVSSATTVINLKIVSVDPAEGWSAELISDNSGDGDHQWWENQKLDLSHKMSEGSVLSFFVKIKKPDNAAAGDKGSAVVKVSCLSNDGNSYVGDNGVIYGGDDEVATIDTMVVE